MRRYSTDPNSPDNPHSPSYVPTYIYEHHVTHGGGPIYKPTQTQEEYSANPQSNMGYAEMDVTVPLSENEYPISKMPGWVEIANIKLTFNGKARSKIYMTQTFYGPNSKNMRFGYVSDIQKWLSSFQLNSNINWGNFNASTASFSSQTSNSLTNNTTTVSSNEMSSSSSTDLGNGVDAENSIDTDGDGNITITSGSSIAGNDAAISYSSDKPTTIVFTFSPSPIKGEYNKTSFEGTLEVELSITLYPVVEVPEKGMPQTQTAPRYFNNPDSADSSSLSGSQGTATLIFTAIITAGTAILGALRFVPL